MQYPGAIYPVRYHGEKTQSLPPVLTGRAKLLRFGKAITLRFHELLATGASLSQMRRRFERCGFGWALSEVHG